VLLIAPRLTAAVSTGILTAISFFSVSGLPLADSQPLSNKVAAINEAEMAVANLDGMCMINSLADLQF
jgi:hypothetical protein